MRAKLWAEARSLYAELLRDGGWVATEAELTHETAVLTMRACIAAVVRHERATREES